MSLISQLVVRKVMQYEEGSLRNKYDFWDFYQAVNLAMAAQGIKADIRGIKLRNRLYANILLDKDAERSFVIISNLLRHDRKIINKFLEEIEALELEEDFTSKLYKKGTIGMLTFEMETLTR